MNLNDCRFCRSGKSIYYRKSFVYKHLTCVGQGDPDKVLAERNRSFKSVFLNRSDINSFFNSSMQEHNFHLYNPRHEFIFYYGSQKHKGKLYEENVWTIPNEIAPDHPTVKPVPVGNLRGLLEK